MRKCRKTFDKSQLGLLMKKVCIIKKYIAIECVGEKLSPENYTSNCTFSYSRGLRALFDATHLKKLAIPGTLQTTQHMMFASGSTIFLHGSDLLAPLKTFCYLNDHFRCALFFLKHSFGNYKLKLMCLNFQKRKRLLFVNMQ